MAAKNPCHLEAENQMDPQRNHFGPCYFPLLGRKIDGVKRPMTIKVSLDQTKHLQELCALDSTALLATLGAAWGLVLGCYTGASDVSFGCYETPPHSSVGDGGLSAAHLDLVRNSTLKQLVKSVKGEYFRNLSGENNESVGSSEASKPGKTSLFNTTLALRTTTATATGVQPVVLNTGLKISKTFGILLPENCRIRILAKCINNTVSIFLEWWSSEMTTDQAAGIGSTFNKAISDIITNPHCSTGDFDPFTDYHKQQILKWNSSALQRDDRCVHEVVQDQALRTPNAEAVCSWDGSFTYNELDEVSSRLAQHLVSIGIGLETRVPLCFDKSKWNIAAMIAVMKAGGAFVPLDPSHPTSRLKILVEAVGASVLLCSRHYAENLRDVVDVVIPLDLDAIDRLSPVLVHPGGLPDVAASNAAYVIFTSGSTGEPKGTLLEHAAYCTSAKAHSEPLHIVRGSRVLQFAAHTFDASLTEILTPLMVGACVCIPSEDARLNNIAKAISEMRVDHAILTPSFVNFLEPADVPYLQTLVLAGEAMSQTHIDIWSKITLVNGFGPSECAVTAAINPNVTPQTDCKDIGFPVGSHCWIVDSENHGRLVPPGCIGELIVEGHTLARCYLNNPEKTADSFVSNIAWANSDDPESPPRRFYKTGDLVRYNSPKGSLNYVGRKDTQVKFHGQRIELGEIEHHLNNAPDVKHGLVLLPTTGHFMRRLVAVFSLSEETPMDSETGSISLKLLMDAEKERYKMKIREDLSARLPTYMIPSIWLCVESMPVLASKKLDRKRISEWVTSLDHGTYRQRSRIGADPEKGGSMIAAGVDGQIQDIWSRVLNIPLSQLTLNKSFLSLGGDSITAMTCMNQCKKAGLGVTVQEVLKSKSIKDLATRVKTVAQYVEYHEEVGRDFELSPIQQYHFQVRQEGQGHFNQSFYLRLDRAIDKQDFHSAVAALVKRHSMLRARFSQAGPGAPWQQRITDDIDGSCRFRSHNVADRAQAQSIMADSQTCLNAIDGPLFSVDLIQINEQEQLVWGIGHHLVIDLVSWRVILEDLQELLLDPVEPSLAVPSIPFQTWTNLQNEHVRDLSLPYVMPTEHIPSDNFDYWGVDSTTNTYGNAACEGFEIDASTTSRLLTESHSALRTELIDVLVAVLIHSFGQIFRDRTVPAIYNEGHGREPWDETIDISRTVGWFTTVYPLFTEVSHSDSLVDVIMRIKDIRRRVPGNGRPYFASRFLTSEGKDAFSHHAPMEVSFNYLGLYQQLEREDAILQPVNEMAGEAREAGGTADFGAATPRFGLFEISAVVVKGKLRFSFTFNRYMKHQDAIVQWIARCQNELCSAPSQLVGMPFTPTLSDFPLLSLTYDSLKSMVTERFPQVGVSAVEEIEDAYPCSPMQQGLLLSRTKDDDFYAVCGTYEVIQKGNSPVSAKTLAAAWKQVVKRHPALRTVFVEGLSINGVYDQVVLKEINTTPVRLSCKSDSCVLQELEKQGFARYKDCEPPHRFTICETPSGKVFCRLELSHAIMDGDSMSIIFRDLAMAYAGHTQDESEPVYSRFVSYLQSQPSLPSIGFWSSYLDGVEPCHFPILNDGVTADKVLRTLRLRYKDLPALQDFCDTNGFTLPNAMHTAWSLTLNNFIGAEDVCFGYLSSGRDAPITGIDNAVGPFINMLACRVNLPEDTVLLNVLDQVQKDYMESLPHKNVSLAEVQHALKLSGTPLFNTCISYRRLPPKTHVQESSISFTEHCPIHDPTEYPLSINIEVSDEEVVIDLDYWTESISDRQAQNVSKNFIRVLENITYNSQQKLATLDNLSSSDYEQIWGWNSRIPETIDDCVHDVIAQQVKIGPNAPAICAWDGDFTYGELDALVTRLSGYLVALGVVPETFVPTCFDKSAYAVISMLAVLRAGAACVPLDANHPKNALETRVLDTEAQIVISSPARAPIFEDMVPYVVPISKDYLSEIPEYGCSPTPAQPSNPAFVIFTSGSTGKPKGVVLEHRSMVTSAEAHGSALGIGSETRFLQFAAYTFDNSLEEMFTTLMRGGCVCVPSEEDRFNNLAGAINKLDVNFMDLTPTVATFFKPSDVPNVKGMAIGGEAMTKRVQEIWGGAIPIHNQYGPSECSINCTHNGKTGHVEDISNIGRSVGSVSWIVSPTNHNKLVPVGCVGELLVEGPIVARGYLNDSEKTSASFIENPTWVALDPNARSVSPRRMYKTGDLVRYDSDGTMCYLGRKDNQVKLNGQRIELGEIEHHVKSHLPTSAQSAVQLIKTGGNKALAAFLCLQEDEPVGVANTGEIVLPMSSSARSIAKEVEAAVSDILPSYMVPTMFIPVRKMPLTSAGKLDRRALLAAAESMPEEQSSSYRLGGSGGRAPTTETEIALQQLWAAVLSKSTESIGADDSFFRHGGDSIGAMKLVSAARAKGIALTVATIFQKPKLSEMANASDASNTSRQDLSGSVSKANLNAFELLPANISISSLVHDVATICQVESSSVEDIYPCTPLQGGLIALSNKQPGAYVAQNVFQLPPDIDIVRFRNAWQAVADSEVVLRTRIVFTENFGFLQVVVKEDLEWHSVDGHHQIKDEHSHLPEQDGGILSRYTIVGEERHGAQFVWTAHHALYDGWSIPTLLERVAAYYRKSPTIDHKVETTFPYFIKYVSSVDSRESDEFWKARLEDPTSPAFPAIPAPGCQVQVTCTLSHLAHLPTSINQDITIASIVRAAWGIIVSLYTYCDDVIFGEILTGRDAPVAGIEDMVGPTLTSVPTRIHINHELTVAEFLHDVQKKFVEAMPYQFAGLQHIKRLGSGPSLACEFQNALAITQDADESAEGFWNLVSGGATVTGFYTYPLNVSCTITQTQVRIDAYYDQNIISTWQMEKILGQFEVILYRLASQEFSQETIGDMNLIGSEDLNELEQTFPRGAEYVDRCIHDIIQDQARSDPHAMAIRSWDASFSYQELEELSTALACHLVGMGITTNPEVSVPLCFEKSAYTVIAMVAVLKSGASILPIDPEHPVSRLREILSDTISPVMLCSPKYRELCESLTNKVVPINLNMLQNLSLGIHSIPVVPTSNAAYIIFTSGSTGKPKGTIVEHVAFASSSAAHAHELGVKPKYRVLQFAPYTFDASLVEILTALMVGACICIPTDLERMNDIAGYINRMQIENACLTPSFAQLLNPEDIPSVKTLSLVGEAMSRTHLSTWANKVNLVNGYGPSECSVSAVINSSMSMETHPANIGRPIDRCWVVDPHNHDRLLPIGAVGELLVEGVTLSRGYLNEPAKTAEVFIKDPKWATSQIDSAERRMYKTGDLVRFFGDGSMDLIFMGRKDTQAKVRGQRLELDEVELRLITEPDIHHALVMIPNAGSLAGKLVAVISLRHLKAPRQISNGMEVVTSAEATSKSSAIRERLRQYLPTYMIPTKWIVLQKLPLLPSGKLDRRQIKAFIQNLEDKPQSPNLESTPKNETKAPPKIDTMQYLQEAWSHALNLPLEEVALVSSFLNHGGDSLSAMQVMARCRSQGLTVTVQDIIRCKSITDLVGCVTIPKIPTIKAEDEKPFALSPIQQAYLNNVGDNWKQFNQSVLFKLTPKRNSDIVSKAINELVKVHSMLRARFEQGDNGEWCQRINQDVPGSTRFLTHNSASSSSIGFLIENSQKALNIKTGPVIAVDLFYLGETETQISIAIHHLVVDVVSWRIILQDFENILNNRPCQGDGLSFQSWSRMQAENAQTLNLEHVLPVSDIPAADFDFWGMAQKENTYGDAMTEEFELSQQTTARLLETCNKVLKSDPVDVLLATILLSFRITYPNRNDPLAIHNEGHGREPWDPEIDISSTVGWFTTMSPIYLPNEADPQKGALLDAIQWVQDFRKRVPGKGQPYFTSRFLTTQGKQRFATHWPVEAAFNYLGQMQNSFQNNSTLQPVGGIDGQSINALSDIGGSVPRLALLEISAALMGETMKLSFGYNKHMDRLDSIQKWLSTCRALLEEVPRCLQAHAVVERQFSLLPLAYGTLGKLEEELQNIDISLAEVDDAYPCSPAQQGILISQTKDPEKYAYHSIFEVRPNREDLTVDIARLEAAWQTVVGRHSSLRTIFIDSLSGQGLKDQIVLKQFQAKTVLVGITDENFDAAFNTLEPLDHANKQPPHRLTICYTPSGRVVCKLEISHAISDGFSMAILLGDLSKAYDSCDSWSKEPLYSGFISHLQSIPKEKSLNYWKDYLSGVEPCLLPSLASYPPPTVRTAGALVLNLDLGAQLQSFCMKEGFTPSNVLQVVWGLVLRAYTNSDEICFGYVSSGRDLPVDGIQEAVGAFINVLICRLDLVDDALLSEVLRKIQTDYMKGTEFKNSSLAEVQHELGLADVPLFNTIFTFQKRSASDNLEQSALSFESLEANDPNEYNVSVNIAAIGSLLEIDFGYWSDTLSDKQAENLSSTFKQTLISLIDGDSDKTIKELDFLGQQSCQQIRSWNAQCPKPVNKCVHELIEQNSLLRPRSTPAVCAWDATFTYHELETQASALSRHLVELGVGPDIYVPLCFEKSAWAIVAQIGVLKAGGAFVPLDPSHPDNRLRGLVDDVGADLVLSSSRYSDKVSRISKRKFIVDANTVHDLSKYPSSPPPTGPHPSNAAYIIFTSGTTGKPKGTVIEHASICTGALSHGEALLLDNTSRVLQFASYTFDASITETLTALIMGACVCVPSDEDRMNDLKSAISKFQVNWALLTPSVLGTLKPDSVPTLKTIVTGGEAMSERIVQEWTGGPALVNAYGPTEASVVASASLKVDRNGVSVDSDRSNIGTGTGCRLWVVDPRNYNRLMPIGATGELVVEGRTLARGYLNNPKKTAEAFICDPEFTRDSRFKGLFSRNCRMYRTGDLVRYSFDGAISYISRKDTQIKLNGQRIELGEIEYHSKLNLPDQAQVAVDLITPSDRKKKTLAVFFTSSIEIDASRLHRSDGSYADELLSPMTEANRVIARSLEAGLTTSIPAYMIPHLFFPVSKLPWSASGKLDRNRLRNIVQDLPRELIRSYRLTGEASRRGAASTLESKLQSMWEMVLGLPAGSVATRDNFFRLGGDSLSAMSLAGVARTQKISLTFANIFKSPILSDMARSCTTMTAELITEIKPFELVPGTESTEQIKSEVMEACNVDENMISDIYPCSPLQEGLVALTIKQPGAYVAQNIFRLSPQLDLGKFKSSWEAVAGAIDVLRTRIVHTISSNFLQVVLKEEPIHWHSVSTLNDISAEVTQVPPSNGGSLTRYTIVDDQSSNSRYFVWTIHHALYDGWSFPLILKQVQRAYQGYPLAPPKISSYSRYIQYLTNTDQSSSEYFWKENLSNISAINFPRTPTSTFNTNPETASITHTIAISGSPTSTEVTIPTLLRAAWAIVIAAHTASDDVCFGETLTGRNINVSGIADIMGPTLTTVPTRIRIEREELVVNFLRGLHQMAADIVPHQHIGLHHIKSLNEDTATACDFQNLLVIQAAGDSTTDDHWCFEKSGDGQNFFTYPLVVECHVAKQEIGVTVYFKENIFGHWTAQRLMDQLSFTFQQLRNISPTAHMSSINGRSPEDRKIIDGWNQPKLVMVEECIHSTFLTKANSQLNAPAICDADSELTYGELKDHASRLAVYLTNVGVGAEVLVPICLDKSLWMVVSIMAVLLAGGAFVPLDPSHPASRHREIVEETGANLVISSPQYFEKFSNLVDKVLIVDENTTNNLPATSSPSNQSVKPHNSAYVIFTSGSTGRAKGIVIEHKSFNTGSAAFGSAMLMHSHSRVLQFASLSFDAAVMEILTTLTLGGCVCVPSEEERLRDIAGAIRRMNITWTLLTPSVANIVDPDTVPCLKTLVCGGEALSPEVISKWADRVTLVNAYGPSESSVVACVNSRVSFERSPTCIGHGIPSTLTWVLDPTDHDKLAPLGAVGELALSGPTLAREYLGNALKTSEGFIKNPAWAVEFPMGMPSPKRIHKTGDLVRYNLDGSLEFIGRKDNQVKLHGQRMELGEIEHRLESDSRIRHVLVLMPKSGFCIKRLTAVISLNDGLDGSTGVSTGNFELVDSAVLLANSQKLLRDVQSRLSDQLPLFMVPQVWAVVQSIPLLSSGKLDRKQAASWIENVDEETYQQIIGIDSYDGSTSPSNGVSKLIQEIWSTVLNIPLEKVKLNQSFLSLGGDSITAMAVISRCRKEKITLSLHDVLRSRSIVHLVECMGNLIESLRDEEIVNQHFDLSPIQQLYFQCATGHDKTSRFNQSFFLRFARHVSPESVKFALRAVVERHSMLRARFSQNDAGLWQQLVSKETETSYRYRLHKLDEKHDIPSYIENSQTCLDITQGPIIATDFFEVRGGDQFIFLVAHHLCVDMVSWRIILQELQEYLEMATFSTDKPLSFQAWCLSQAKTIRLHNTTYQPLSFDLNTTDLSYWGMEGQRNTYQDVDSQSFSLDIETTSLALGDSRHAFQTEPIDLFLSAIAHSFSRVFRDRKIPTLFNEGHGRESSEINADPSRTVGWFTTIYPLAVQVGSEYASDGVLDTLRRTKDHRSIMGNGRQHFAKAVSSRNACGMEGAPPMELLFNYLGRMQQFERDDSLLQQADLEALEKHTQNIEDVGPDMVRFALFEVSAIVIEGQLQFTFMYNRNMQRGQNILRWISECKTTIEEMVDAMVHITPEPTLSDYPLLPISYEGLKKLLKTTFPKVGITHRDQVDDIYPCSPMQEGIILSQIRDPASYLFNAIFQVKSRDPMRRVDARKVEKSWQMVVNRHAALRTVFIDSLCKGSTFDQLVVKEASSGAISIDCEDSDVTKQLNAIELRETANNRCPKLPHQLTICTTPSGKVVVKIEINHAVIDGGSVSILMRDLAAAYAGQLPNNQGPLYSDYIRYIRRNPAGGELSFWKEHLNGLKPCYLKSIGSKPQTERRLLSVHVNFNRYPEVQALCEKSSITLANFIHGAWALVLKHYTGSDDVCFGYLSAGRDAPVSGIQDAIGAYINMLCCRVQFRLGISDLIKNVQDEYLRSLPHQLCSLAHIQHELGLAGKPLFNTALSIQNHGRSSDGAAEDLIFEPLTAHDPSEYAVTVNVETAKGDEGIVLRYWSDHVNESEAQLLAKTMADSMADLIDKQDKAPSGSNSEHPTSQKQQRMGMNEGLPKSAKIRPALRPPTSVIKSNNTGLLDSHEDLRRLVDTSVQNALQHMIESGALVNLSLGEATSLVSRKLDESLDLKQQSGANGLAVSPNNRSTEKRTTLPDIHIQSTSTSSISYSTPDHFSTKESDNRSMAAHINSRGRAARVEKKLLRLWSSMLEMEEDSISGDDSFFELGGDSLTAMKLVGAAREEGLAMTVADVFRNPVFEDMVTIIHAASMVTSYMESANMSDYNVQSQAIRLAGTSELYQRFSLVKAPNIDTFLQNSICPKIGVFKGGIADVLPVTDFQALAITGSLLESRWMLNYFSLDGNGSLDLRMLKRSCFRLTQASDILRTVFLPCGDRFLQVVLRKMRPDFFVYETESDLDDFMAMLQERDREEGPRLGEPFVNFTVVKRKESDQHRIVMRISHAQYDGVSLPKILDALQSGYDNDVLPSISSFASYVRASAGTITSDHYQYWRGLLKGSRMTEIVRRKGPNYRRSAGETGQLKQSVLLPTIAQGSITTATVIKAAWALVLAQLSGNADVVFGHTISGRNATIPGVESAVGPCLNIIPVRVKFGANWTALDLLRYVQDQQVTNMPYEALGFREITRHCTEWPDWTNFTTVVQHQNMSRDEELRIGRNMYKLHAIGADEDFSDFSITSKPVGNDKCEICLGFSQNGSITPIFAQKVLNMLCNTISTFIADPNTRLISATQISSLPAQTMEETNNPPASYFLSSQLEGLSRAEVLVLSDFVTSAWRQVLGEQATQGLSVESSFFDLNGDIMSLAQVAWLLEQEGFKVRVEDLIDHPTMLGHMATLCSQKFPEKSHGARATSSVTSLEEVEPAAAPPRRREKEHSWFKAMNIARKIVKRNTNPV